MEISAKQMGIIGAKLRAARMRTYLNEHFPESRQMPDSEMEGVILRLLDQAACYKLVLDAHAVPFLVAAWVMGEDFVDNFLAAREILEDLDLDSPTKAERLWQFLVTTIGLLEGGHSSDGASIVKLTQQGN